MSALASLLDYGSSSDESSGENCTSKPKKAKLYVPDLTSVLTVSPEEVDDNPNKHKGRVRTFPHVRGNWASFVYWKYPDENSLGSFLNKIEDTFIYFKDNLYKCDDFHISLSKTFVLQYHLISPFTKSLQNELSKIERFQLEFSSIKIYTNEEETRTFIALEVCYLSRKKLSKICHKVDRALEDFQLPLFYENPSFHMSVLWLNGNKKAKLLSQLDKLNEFFAHEIANNCYIFNVDNINWKIGNKYFQYSFK